MVFVCNRQQFVLKLKSLSALEYELKLRMYGPFTVVVGVLQMVMIGMLEFWVKTNERTKFTGESLMCV